MKNLLKAIEHVKKEMKAISDMNSLRERVANERILRPNCGSPVYLRIKEAEEVAELLQRQVDARRASLSPLQEKITTLDSLIENNF